MKLFISKLYSPETGDEAKASQSHWNKIRWAGLRSQR